MYTNSLLWGLSFQYWCFIISNRVYLSRDMTKPTKWLCAQRTLRSAWASARSDQSSLSAWRKLGSLATQWSHSEDSDQTGLGAHSLCWFCHVAAHFYCRTHGSIISQSCFTYFRLSCCGWFSFSSLLVSVPKYFSVNLVHFAPSNTIDPGL